jgi:two-component system, LytTR family, response regulator AlgR
MNRARILIVDDEAPARARLRDLLDDCRSAFPLIIADEATNGREAVEIVNNSAVDIVLLDIRMPGMDGIETARHLARRDKPPRLIFTTAFDAYAVKAFEVNAIDYLLKPIKRERLLAALQKAGPRPPSSRQLENLGPAQRKHLSIHERGRVILIPLEEVIFMRAEMKYLSVRTAAREYLLEESLTRLEDEFSELFTRVHRNTLVAKRAIAGFEKVAEEGGEGRWVVVLKGIAEKLPVSRRQQHIVREF